MLIQFHTERLRPLVVCQLPNGMTQGIDRGRYRVLPSPDVTISHFFSSFMAKYRLRMIHIRSSQTAKNPLLAIS